MSKIVQWPDNWPAHPYQLWARRADGQGSYRLARYRTLSDAQRAAEEICRADKTITMAWVTEPDNTSAPVVILPGEDA